MKKRKISLRLLSLALTVLLLATTLMPNLITAFAIGETTEVTETDTFDGGFEQAGETEEKLSPTLWYVTNTSNGGANAVRDINEKHAGNASLRFDFAANTNVQYNMANSILPIEVEPNTTYQISYWAKRENYNGRQYFMLFNNENQSDWLIGAAVSSGETAGWIHVCQEFTTGANTTKMGLQYAVDGMDKTGDSAEGHAWIDDIRIIKVEFDGGFERIDGNGNFSAWQDWGGNYATVAVEDEVVHKGKHSLRFDVDCSVSDATISYNYISADSETNLIPVKENTTYQLSYWVKKENVAGVASMITIYDSNLNLVKANAGTVWDGTTDWLKVTDTFTTGIGVTRVRLIAQLYGANTVVNDGKIYFDDITVEELPANIHELKSGFDGGFEVAGAWSDNVERKNWAFGTWEAVGNATVVRDTNVKYQGLSSVGLSDLVGGGETYIQTVHGNYAPVQGGTPYTISVKFKTENMTGVPFYLLVVPVKDNGEWDGNHVKTIDVTDDQITALEGSEWKVASVDYLDLKEVAELSGCQKIVVRIAVWNTQSANSKIWFDDVLLETGRDIDTSFDAGFERFDGESYDAWDVIGKLNFGQDTGNKTEGNASLKITRKNGKEDTGALQSKESWKVTPNTEYIISFDARQENVKGDVIQYLMVLNKKGEPIADPIVVTGANNGKWTTVYGSIKTGEDIEEIYIQVCSAGTQKGDGDAILHFDNLALQTAPDGMGEFDGGFEVVLGKQPLSWSVVLGGDCFTAEDKTVQSGNYSAKITKTERGDYNASSNILLPVKGGQAYEATYYMKGTNDTVHRGIMLTQLKEDGVSTVDNKDAIYVSLTGVDGEIKDWSKVYAEFTAAPDAKYVRVSLVVVDRKSYASGKEHNLYDEKEAVTWFDAFSMTEAKAETELIKNGGFEKVSFGTTPIAWNTFALTDGVENKKDFTIGVTPNGQTGNGLSMVKRGAGYAAAHPSTHILIEPGQSYELSYWVKATNATNCSHGIAVQQFADTKGTSQTQKNSYMAYNTLYGNTDGWQKLTFVFTTEKDAKAIYVIPTFNDTTGGKKFSGTSEVIFDEISLKKVETLGPIDNFGFEYGTDVPRDWALTVGAFTTEGWESLDPTKFNWKMTDVAHSGKQALKLNTGSADGYIELRSPLIPVKRSSDYLVSYWVKMTGSSSGRVGVSFHMWSDTSTTGNADPEWIWLSSDYDAAGSDGEWKKITIPITTAADCDWLDMRFVAKGNGMTAILDDVSLELLTEETRKELNLSFEKGDKNWAVINSGSPNAQITSKYSHNGEKSLYIQKNNSYSDTQVIGLGQFEVQDGAVLMFGGYYKSRNTLNSKLKINAVAYDKNGKEISTILGQLKPLNGSSEYHEWKKMVYTGAVPDGTAKVALEAVITGGRTEVYLDDFFYRIANYNEEETLVDFSDFNGVTESGKIDGWGLHKESGNATFEVKKIGTNPVGVLTVSDGAKASAYYETEWLLAEEQYRVTADYNFSQSGNVTIKFYDYKGNYLEGVDVVEKITASEDGNLEFTFTAPSSVRAEFHFGGNLAGTYQVDNLEIILQDVRDANQSWLGKWVWYREDALTECVKESRYFLYHFELDGKATYAPLQVVCDDNFAIWVNGQEVGSEMVVGDYDWSQTMCYDILPYLVEGDNVIAIEGYNNVSYAALIFDGRITMEDESEVLVISDSSVVASKTAPEGWNQPGYDCSGWGAVRVIGAPPASPWGSVYFDTALYADNAVEIVEIVVPDEIKAGTTIELTGKFKIEEPIENDYPIEVNLFRKNTTNQITSGVFEIIDGNTISKWEVGKVNEVKMRFEVPDYLETANYTIQLSDKLLYLTNEDVIDGKFMNISVIQTNSQIELPTAKIEDLNGKSTIFINGEAKAPLIYGAPHADMWLDLSKEKLISNSDTEMYISQQAALHDPLGRIEDMWLDEATIDFANFDKGIYKTLSIEPDAQIMLGITMSAPHWWLDLHPDEEYRVEVKDPVTGEIVEQLPEKRMVSFSSEIYRQEAGEVLRQLIEHIAESSYAGHIYAIKINDGATYEYLLEGVSEGAVPDFSAVSLVRFREYLQEKYKTNEALQKAWNDPKVTFETATIPRTVERNSDKYLSIIDAETNRRTIDYNYFVSTQCSESFMHYAQVIKEACNDRLIVGGYHGYLWNAAGNPNGNAHLAINEVLECEDIDFIATCYTYGERDLGEAASFNTPVDSVREHGKLYILEVDTRSVFDDEFGNAEWDSDVGYCYTMEESVNSLKRDAAVNMAKGCGFWFCNMYGNWWYDDQFMGVLKDIKEEMNYSLYLERETVSDVAVYIDEMMYPYISSTDTYGVYAMMKYMLSQQRRNFAVMGAPYDVYSMQDLVKGVSKEHKINIMISPFEITDEERLAIENRLKKDDKIIVWIYLPGISDGTNRMDEALIRDLTGMNTKVLLERGEMSAIMTDKAGTELTEGIDGLSYGGILNLSGPLAYIDDSSAIELAKATFKDGTKTAMAMKDMGDWTSIYSTIINLPSEFFRNLLNYANQHTYSDDNSDIVYASSSYVAVHSMYGGKKTLYLDGDYAVYDVFKEEYNSMNTSVVKYEMEDGETKIFRLSTPDKISVLTRTRGAHAEITPLGITEVNPGDAFEAKIKVDKGYYLKDVTVNGESIGTDNIVKLENVTNSTSIEAFIERVIEEDEDVVQKEIKWVLLAVISTAALVLVIGSILFVLYRKKKREEESKTEISQK